jgi:hypothetical protein
VANSAGEYYHAQTVGRREEEEEEIVVFRPVCLKTSAVSGFCESLYENGQSFFKRVCEASYLMYYCDEWTVVFRSVSLLAGLKQAGIWKLVTN